MNFTIEAKRVNGVFVSHFCRIKLSMSNAFDVVTTFTCCT